MAHAAEVLAAFAAAIGAGFGYHALTIRRERRDRERPPADEPAVPPPAGWPFR